MSDDAAQQTRMELTVDIVTAYVAKNPIRPQDIPALIRSVHETLGNVMGERREEPEQLPAPPVPIRKTITPDYLISLEDGRQYRSLRRHLSARGMTPDQYRAKWGLPPTYPMVAETYAKARSELAKSLGLGSSRRKAPPTEPEPEATPPARKPSRRTKTEA